MVTKNINITTNIVSGDSVTANIQGNESIVPIVTATVTPAIISSVQDLLVAVKVTGYGEEAVPDPTLFKRLDDYNTVVEAITVVLTKVLPDTINTTETVSKFIQPGVVDTVGISELLTFTWNIVRNYNDTVSPTDQLTFTWNALRSYADTVTISESKVANLQTYFQADFVQPGYVGTNITL